MTLPGLSPAARTPENVANSGREFTHQINVQDAPVQTHRPPVVDPIVRSATPTRASRVTAAYTLAQRWWEDWPAFWGRASFGARNVVAGTPRGVTSDPSRVRTNIVRPASVTTAEAMGSAVPGLETDWI